MIFCSLVKQTENGRMVNFCEEDALAGSLSANNNCSLTADTVAPQPSKNAFY
jgi:hypothetical protein